MASKWRQSRSTCVGRQKKPHGRPNPDVTKKNGRTSDAAVPQRAVIYRRVSSEVQAEKVSPEIQLAESEDYAREQGYLIVGVYTDTEKYRVRGRMVEPSGTRADRPGFQRLLADGRAGNYDVIVAWKEDRLYRGVRPAVLVDDLMESAGVRVELVKETFDRKMLFIKASVGKIELENIRERTEMGSRERVRSGYHHGGRLPLGYVAVKDPTGRTTGYAFDPIWRDFFDELAKRFLNREPYYRIAQAFGTHPVTGKLWQTATIRFLLTNPWYRGQLAYGWITRKPDFVADGQQPKAWDDATCAAVEHELTRREMVRHSVRGHALFSGLLRCGICGRLLCSLRTSAGRTGSASYQAYGCFRPTWVRCGTWAGRRTHEPVFINEKKLIGLLRDTFSELTVAEVDELLGGLAMAMGGVSPDDGSKRKRLEAEAVQLRDRLADLAVGLDGVRNKSAAATEALLATITQTGRRLDRVRADVAEMETRRSALPDLASARIGLLKLIKHPETWNLSSEQLQPLLRQALPALYVKGGGLADPVAEWKD